MKSLTLLLNHYRLYQIRTEMNRVDKDINYLDKKSKAILVRWMSLEISPEAFKREVAHLSKRKKRLIEKGRKLEQTLVELEKRSKLV